MRITLLRRCYECGQPLGKKDVFCPRCGAKQPREPKKKWTGLTRFKQTDLSLFFASILLIM